MRLDDDEKILKVYYRHYYPFLIMVFKLIGVSLPFYFLIYLVVASDLSARRNSDFSNGGRHARRYKGSLVAAST